MLVLKRMTGEKIVIDGGITVVVVEIRGDKVRLGIEAPKSVAVHRKEIWDLLKGSGRNGSDGNATDSKHSGADDAGGMASGEGEGDRVE